MGQEIERKFLVKDDSYKLEAYAHSHIVQGYICSCLLYTSDAADEL